jgi:hypothetical protein
VVQRLSLHVQRLYNKKVNAFGHTGRPDLHGILGRAANTRFFMRINMQNGELRPPPFDRSFGVLLYLFNYKNARKILVWENNLRKYYSFS